MNYHAIIPSGSGIELSRTTMEEHLRFSTRAALLAKDAELRFAKPLGISLQSFLFRPLTGSLLTALQNVVRELIHNREPRVEVVEVQIKPDLRLPGRMNLLVDYRIKETKKVDRCQVTL